MDQTNPALTVAELRERLARCPDDAQIQMLMQVTAGVEGGGNARYTYLVPACGFDLDPSGRSATLTP